MKTEPNIAELIAGTDVKKVYLTNIKFFITHLDVKDLSLVSDICLTLCKNNSQSYKDWWNKTNNQ